MNIIFRDKNLIRYFMLAFFLIFSTVTGLYNLTGYKLSNDETITVNVATGFGHTPNRIPPVEVILPDSKVFTQKDFWQRNTAKNVLKYTAADNGNMVSYNFFLHYIIKLFGFTDWMLRALSVLFYVLSVYFLYRICRLLTTSETIPLLTLLLFVCNPFILNYARQIRSYEACMFLSLVTSFLILKEHKKGNRNIISSALFAFTYGILFSVAFLGHYYFIYIFAGHCLFLLLAGNYRLLVTTVSSFLLVIVSFYVWYIHGGDVGLDNMRFVDKYILAHTSEQTLTSFRSITEGLITFLTSVNGYYFQYFGYRVSSFFYLVSIIIFIVGSAIWYFIRTWKTENRQPFLFLISMTGSALFVLIASAIKAGHTTSFHSRYGLFAAPYFSLLLAFGLYALYKSEKTNTKILSVILLITHLVLNIANYKVPIYGQYFTYFDTGGDVEKARHTRPPANTFSKNAEEILKNYSQGDTVLFKNANNAQYTNLYLKNSEVEIVQKIDTTIKDNFYIKHK